MSESVYDLLKRNVTLAGGTPKEGDTRYNLWAKWVKAKGGTPLPLDTETMLLQKLAARLSITVYPGDSVCRILQRIFHRGAGQSIWDCLKHGTTPPSPPPAPNPPVLSYALLGPGDVMLTWTNAIGDTSYRLDIFEDADHLFQVLYDEVVYGAEYRYNFDISGAARYVKVRAVNTSGTSADSNEVNFIIP